MVKEAKKDELGNLRHSLAHLLAAAVVDLYTEAKPTIGPAVDNGFYYDFDLGEATISEDDLPKIEKRMRKILPSWHGFHRIEVDEKQAREIFKKNPYKLELIEEIVAKGEPLTLHYSGPAKSPPSAEDIIKTQAGGEAVGAEHAIELCRGGHADDLAASVEPGSFKLDSVAGAYWRGDENNTMLTRIYGLAFPTSKELGGYLAQREEAKARDHRKLGKDLDLFFISEHVGAGLPLLMPKGETIKNLLMRYMRQKEEALGYQYVATPVLAQSELYERSGHADYYLENMYATEADEEDNKFYLKPMNCPHHHMIYEKIVKSYRDLPLKLAEHAGLYRYELSGTLTGLIRMRGSITQNDSHHYVTPDQLKEEFLNVLNLFKDVYGEVGVKDYWYRLSLPDFNKGKYAGDQAEWERGAAVIRESLQETEEKYVEVEDEAAFYGPKLDVQVKNVLGNEDSIATIQIDILVPERMGLTYIDQDSQEQHPIIIHKSLMGAFERFMAFLLEQTAGHLPFWLAPEQIRILTVNDSVMGYVDKITSQLKEIVLMKPVKYNEVRFTTDIRNESLGKKIREAEVSKIPVILIVGPKDEATVEVSVRTNAGESKVKLDKLQAFLEKQ